ncbi:TAXI family TRAP transporter solute-binding subunit [Nitratireductor pacificus]|uniref:31 kDa immunogenic protein n=1 Tax=Nitratireductor pacificus pht-3B TaxID=391937 RepID=K2MIU9_9HYPH|nr:TAXI family TRAP transporter solute-binding subunit [Nitratireductor pacificus]EKF20620.1 31 kDa immunogenic protein [Nitratireductor pacificus pht-3B]
MKTSIVLSMLASLAAASGLPAVANAEPLSFVTGGQGGSWYGIGAGMADVFEKAGVDVSVEIGGGMSNIIAVGRGDSEIGMTNGFAVPMAAKGEAPFAEPVGGVKALGVFMLSIIQVPVLADSDVRGYEDLKGKKFCLLPLSASSTIAFQKVFAAFGMTEDDVDFSRGNLGYCVSQMKDRKVIGTSAATAMPVGSFSELAASVPVRFLDVDDAALKRIQDENPAFVRVSMPADVYRGVGETVATVGTQALLIANENLPEETAYTLVKAMAENLEETRGVHSGMEDLSVEGMAAVAGMELHPGALRYYREVGAVK